MKTHQYNLVTRHSELDINQHINNTNYLRYLEEARVQMMRERELEISTVHNSPVDMVLYKYNCYFKQQVYYNEELEVFSTQIQTRKVRGILRQEIRRKSDKSVVFVADAYWAFIPKEPSAKELALKFAQNFGKEEDTSIHPFAVESLPSLEPNRNKVHITQAVARPYEMDSFFHMNNAVYSAYYELSRWMFIKDQFGLEVFRNSKIGSVIYRSLIEYIQPVLGFDELQIKTWLAELTKTRTIYHHEMTDATGTVRSRARSEICFIDSSRGIPVKIPTELLELYSGVLSSC
jgi:YbgC/YbaW family acyl-CoA thioester hydrolase